MDTGFDAHSSPWLRSEWGGNTPGQARHIAGGAVGPHGLSPEAISLVTPDGASGQRASGFSWFGACGRGLGFGIHGQVEVPEW